MPEAEANLDAVAFHAQQAAERFMKAVLQSRGTYFPKTRDLVDLAALFTPTGPRLMKLEMRLEALTTYAVEIRYPGFSMTRTRASEALQTAEQVRDICLDLLGIEP